ncbi:MAG: MmgE/PrpD family protein [Candidatus Micrarchaeota archaeon]|nr:MmgE/PrpD family protein [Candidatus Micrarchaeota archaeon]
MTITISGRIAEYASSLRYSDFDKPTIEAAKARIIDTFGCAIGAQHETPVEIASKSVQDTDGRYRSTILGTGRKVSPDIAAFVNGGMSRYFDFMDTYDAKEFSHPSDNIFPMVAVAEAEGLGGRDVLLGTVLAYEIQCRLCDAATLWKRGWDHVIYGLVSVSAAASRLMGLSVGQTEQAINIALNSHLTMRQLRAGELSMWKAVAFSNSARNAIFSAMLARNGFTGPAPVFEGEMGFWKQVTGRFEIDTRKFGGKRNRFKIGQTLIKHFPAETRAQTAIEAALELRKVVPAEKIRSVEIGTNEGGLKIIGSGAEKWDPKTKETADHSLPYMVAAALMDGKVDLASFTEKRYRDAKTLQFMKRVKVVERKRFTDMFNKGGTVNAADVVITAADGKRVSKEVIYSKGHPRTPMSPAEIEAKFKSVAGRNLERGSARRVLDTIWDLEHLNDIRRLMYMVS